MPEVGSTSNRYEVLAKLAEGGMAEIFLARGASAGGVERYVVLKRILPSLAHDAQFVQMFLDEARLAAQLQHPNVAQVYDVGRLGESYFFTMEYIHGETVRAIIKRALALPRQVPIASALAIAAGAAAGLHHAHTRKGAGGRSLEIVHRDVSPSNLIVSYEGHVKVVDFGVAKAAGKVSRTASGTLKGKIAYLAPEQCNSAAVDRRTDLFALGIVMWELVTGQYLYRRDSDYLAMTAICDEPPPPPSTLRRDATYELDQVVLRLLAKDPTARFQTAGEVVDAIEAIAARAGTPVTANALARFMHEWFGERAEPWIEHDQLAAASIVTVNSEPLAAAHAPSATVVDEQLRRVPTLPPNVFDGDQVRAQLHAGMPTFSNPKMSMPTIPDRPSTVGGARERRSLAWIGLPIAVIVAIAMIAFAATRSGSHAARPIDAPASRAVAPTAAAAADAPAHTDAPLPAIDAAPVPTDAPLPIDGAIPRDAGPHGHRPPTTDPCRDDPMACMR